MTDAAARVARGQLPSRTARVILRDVLARGLKAGDPLGDESWCIEHYGVSRGTLREALRLLTFLGAVSVKSGPHGGPQLTTPGSAVVGSALGIVVQFRGATLHAAFEARLALEPSVASVAAANRTADDAGALRCLIDRLRETHQRQGNEYAEERTRFHVAIAEATHNDVLATMVSAMAALTATVSFPPATTLRPAMLDLASGVVEAICSQDGVAAARGMNELLTRAIAYLVTNQPTQMRRRILWPDVDEVLTESRYC